MSEKLWAVYRIFYDPPGTPKELKCIGCKIASGTASLALAGASTYGLVKSVRKSIYIGAAYATAAFCFAGTAAVLYRLAFDYQEYNQSLVKNNVLAIRQKRKEIKAMKEHAPTRETSQSI